MAIKTKAKIVSTANRKTSSVPAVKAAAVNANKETPVPAPIATTQSTQAVRAVVVDKARAVAAAKKNTTKK